MVVLVYVDRSFFAGSTVSMSASVCSSVLVAYNMSQCVDTFFLIIFLTWMPARNLYSSGQLQYGKE